MAAVASNSVKSPSMDRARADVAKSRRSPSPHAKPTKAGFSPGFNAALQVPSPLTILGGAPASPSARLRAQLSHTVRSSFAGGDADRRARSRRGSLASES